MLRLDTLSEYYTENGKYYKATKNTVESDTFKVRLEGGILVISPLPLKERVEALRVFFDIEEQMKSQC